MSREKDYITHMRSKPRARRSQDGDSPTDENQALGRLLGNLLMKAIAERGRYESIFPLGLIGHEY